MDWQRTEIISTIALVISSLGFLVSYLSYRRAARGDRPIVWLEIQSIGATDCWLATIHFTNPTSYVLKIGKIAATIQRVPIDARQDFILGDLQEALAECGGDATKLASSVAGKDRHFSLIPTGEKAIVDSGSSGTFQCLIFRGRLSTARKAKLTIHYQLMDKRPRDFKTNVYGDAPGPGLEIHLARI